MNVTKIAVSVQVQADAGYSKHVQYIEECQRRRIRPEFGMRDQSNESVFVSQTLENPEGVAEELAHELAIQKIGELRELCTTSLMAILPTISEDDLITETQVEYGDPDEF